jgi:N-acetylglucosaminyl-diphospho-decaprenol L-rhamnosyltransferase
MTVDAVVVSYNVRNLVLRTIAGLRADGIDNVVVVDNASTDRSAEAVRQAEPAVDLVALDRNLGFAGGVNLAVGRTSSPYVLVTTPDVLLAPGSTKLLEEVLDESADVGLVAPSIVTTDGEVYPSARRFPSLCDAAGHAFLHFLWPRNRFSVRYKMLDVDRTAAADVDWVAGTHFLVRRSAWDEVGGFDERFFMFVEDVDLCWRLGEAGWKVRYEPAAEVVHEISRSADQVPYRMILAHHRSLYRFNVKRAQGRQRYLLPVIAAGLAARTVLAWAQRALRGRPHAAP